MVLIAGITSDMFLGGLKARLAGKKMVGGVASEHRDILEAVVKLAAQGVLQPVIDRRYAFDELKAAHVHVDAGHKKENVVVTVKSHDRARSFVEMERQSKDMTYA